MSLADDIVQALPNATRRRTWFDDLPSEAAAELCEVRSQWRAGKYGPKLKSLTLGKLLVARCQERGWEICDARRMSEWLRQND